MLENRAGPAEQVYDGLLEIREIAIIQWDDVFSVFAGGRFVLVA